MLNAVVCQKIVAQVISHVKCNVNIMNKDAIIIASGNPDRIGTFHKAASDAISKNCRIDVTKTNEPIYPGGRIGINTPFYVNGTLAGVIGISGEPQEIESIVSITKAMAELLLEQERLKEHFLMKESKKFFFINSIITIQNKDDESKVISWGESGGYNMRIFRQAIVISILDKELREKAARAIENLQMLCSENFYAAYDLDKLIVFHAMQGKPKITAHDYIQRVLGGIGAQSDKLLIGIGGEYDQVAHLKYSVLEALNMLSVAKAGRFGLNCVHIDDHALSRVMSHLPRDITFRVLAPYLSKLQNESDFCDTIIKLYTNNMSMTKASKEGFVHRNTMVFRLAKLKECMGLDPFGNENDRTIFKLLAEYLLMYGVE